MNAIDLLLRDHREQESLLEKLLACPKEEEGVRRDLFCQFRSELAKHINIEEEIFYPRLEKIPQFQQKVLEALEEHKLCMLLLQELDGNEPLDEKVWEAKLKVLEEMTHHHIKEEERDLFPQVRELASEEYLGEMGEQMRIQKKNTSPDDVMYPEDK